MNTLTKITLILGSATVIVFVASMVRGADTTEFIGCLQTKNGTIYNVGQDGKTPQCRPGDVVVRWNQQGPQGLQGPQGETGPKGEKGDPGAKPQLRTIKRFKTVRAYPGALTGANMDCDPGEIVTGGGYLIDDRLKVIRSTPTGTDTQGWGVDILNLSEYRLEFDIWAVCLSTSPQ